MYRSMKYSLLFLLVIVGMTSLGQITNGIYKSSEDSFREYYLIIESDSVSLFGWRVSHTGDTLFFRAGAEKLVLTNDSLSIKFGWAYFIENPFKLLNMRDANCLYSDCEGPYFRYHRNFSGTVQDEKLILIGTMDSYESRADSFIFKFIE